MTISQAWSKHPSRLSKKNATCPARSQHILQRRVKQSPLIWQSNKVCWPYCLRGSEDCELELLPRKPGSMIVKVTVPCHFIG